MLFIQVMVFGNRGSTIRTGLLIYVYICMIAYIYMYICMNTYVQTHIYICTCAHGMYTGNGFWKSVQHIWHGVSHIYVHIYDHTYTYVHEYIYVYICTHIYIYIYEHMYICIYLRMQFIQATVFGNLGSTSGRGVLTYMHTYMITYIYIYIHIYIYIYIYI